MKQLKQLVVILYILFTLKLIVDIAKDIWLFGPRPTHQEVYNSIYNSTEFQQYVDSIAQETLKKMCPSLTQDNKDFDVLRGHVENVTATLRRKIKFYNNAQDRVTLQQWDKFSEYEWGKQEE